MMAAIGDSHGEMLRNWTKWLKEQDRVELEATLMREATLTIESEKLDDGLSMRIADAFSFMAGALILARKAGLLKWSKEEIRSAVRTSLRAVLDRVKDRPQLDPLAALRAALQQEGALLKVTSAEEGTSMNWLAAIHPEHGLLVRSKRLRQVLGAEYAKSIHKALAEAGQLRRPEAEQIDVGGNRPRVLIVDPKFLA